MFIHSFPSSPVPAAAITVSRVESSRRRQYRPLSGAERSGGDGVVNRRASFGSPRGGRHAAVCGELPETSGQSSRLFTTDTAVAAILQHRTDNKRCRDIVRIAVLDTNCFPVRGCDVGHVFSHSHQFTLWVNYFGVGYCKLRNGSSLDALWSEISRPFMARQINKQRQMDCWNGNTTQ